MPSITSKLCRIINISPKTCHYKMFLHHARKMFFVIHFSIYDKATVDWNFICRTLFAILAHIWIEIHVRHLSIFALMVAIDFLILRNHLAAALFAIIGFFMRWALHLGWIVKENFLHIVLTFAIHVFQVLIKLTVLWCYNFCEK